MRMLFVANTARNPNQGASGCDIATIDALRKQGHDIDEIWGDDMPRRIRHHNLHQLIELPSNYANAIADRCRSCHYDVIQVNQPHAFLAARQHQRQHRKGIFINRSHGWEPALNEACKQFGDKSADRRPLWKKLASWQLGRAICDHNRQVLKWADAIVIGSSDDLEYIHSNYSYDRNRALVLALGLSELFLAAPHSQPRNRWLRALHVANFTAQKAPHIVAEVFTQLLDHNPASTVTWVCGKNDHDAVRRLLKRDYGYRVKLLDWMPRAELVKLYDDHGLFIFPSLFEGFGLAPLEAMARGMCVLSTPIAGMRVTIQDGTNGFLFGRGRADEMAARAKSLIDAPNLCDEISRAARAAAVGYTWERTANQYVQFCEQLIANKNRSTRRAVG